MTFLRKVRVLDDLWSVKWNKVESFEESCVGYEESIPISFLTVSLGLSFQLKQSLFDQFFNISFLNTEMAKRWSKQAIY